MFDTNAFDRLICDQFFPDVWQAASRGMLQLFTCEIQEQEIARIENKRKRCLIQSIPRQVIASAASCEASGNHLHHDPKQMPPDLVIAHTAAQYCSLFVTEDRQLLQWYREHYPDKHGSDYQQFICWFLEHFVT